MKGDTPRNTTADRIAKRREAELKEAEAKVRRTETQGQFWNSLTELVKSLTDFVNEERKRSGK